MARDGYRIFDSDTHVGPDAAHPRRLSERGRKGRGCAGWEAIRVDRTATAM